MRRSGTAWLLVTLGACVTARAALIPAAPSPPTLHLDNSEGRLGYDDSGGPGPLVLMVPGIGDLRQEYRHLIPLLTRAGCRVATVDLRGFGGSAGWRDTSARAVGGDLIRLESRLGRRTAILVGNSYAAGAVVWAAHDAPGRVGGLVLLAPALRDPPAPSWYGRAAMALAFAGPWRVPLWLRYWDSLFPARTPPDQGAYRLALARDLRQPGRMDALDAMLHLSKAPTTEILGRVRVPMLVVMGTRDPDFDDPRAEAAWVVRQTGARLQLVPQAGHYPQAEMPEQVAPAMVRFVQATIGAARPAVP